MEEPVIGVVGESLLCGAVNFLFVSVFKLSIGRICFRSRLISRLGLVCRPVGLSTNESDRIGEILRKLQRDRPIMIINGKL